MPLRLPLPSPPPPPLPAGAAAPPAFSEIAQRCQQGGYDGVDELQGAAAAAAAHVLAAAAEERQRARQEQRRGGRPPSPDYYRWGLRQAVVEAAAGAASQPHFPLPAGCPPSFC